MPVRRAWRSFHASTAGNLGMLRSAVNGPFSMVATVPPQHMYGMEMSVLLPLLGGHGVHAGRPFFPADVAAALAQIPAPRVLVTTPLHLRALVESGVALAPVAAIVSATAPLPSALAQAAEARFGAPLREVFGSTETCVFASRRAAAGEDWQLYADVVLHPRPDGTAVRAPQLATPSLLADLVSLSAGGRRFRWCGRRADLLEIAGKRASLGDLTRRLLAVPGVRDGVVFQLDDGRCAGRAAHRRRGGGAGPGRGHDCRRAAAGDRSGIPAAPAAPGRRAAAQRNRQAAARRVAGLAHPVARGPIRACRYNARYAACGRCRSWAMKVLVIGSGAREHALAWKLRQSPRVDTVLVAPGNAGTAREAGVRNVEVAADDIDGLLALARAEQVDLTVVGPEVPLVAGVVDRFDAAGLRIFGPRAVAAQLEGSKAFAKDFLLRHAIPTAGYAVFSELEPALAYVRDHAQRSQTPIVIKADGLAAGKGVVIAETLADAELALRDMLGARRFGAASARVVIEEFLDGEEASYIVMRDGKHVLPLASSQDHKRRDDGDLGPNTGGMGAYSPAPVVTAQVERRILREIIEPTVRAMAAEGAPFVGFLYAGLMIDRTVRRK